MIDLHTHSCYSDGTSTPAELLKAAAGIGLKAVALTDHDTVAGVKEFLAEAEKYPGLEAVPGIELACRYCTREIHVLGLYIDPDDPEFFEFIEKMRLERVQRSEAIRLKLKTLGFPLDDEDFEDFGRINSFGRPHFAAALLRRYPDKFKDWDDVFSKLLKNGAAAFVPRVLPMLDEVIRRIHGASGVAVWAHPVYRSRNERSFVRRILKRFVPEGLDGVEAYYSLYSPAETEMLSAFAEEFSLVRSGGSDFHGEMRGGIQLGFGGGKLSVPDSLLDEIKKRKQLLCSKK